MIRVSKEEMDELRHLIQAHLPKNVKAYAFGSRATGTARPGSDLDILLLSSHPIDWHLMAELEEALSESDLPFRVDLVDKARTAPEFLQRIDDELVRVL